MDCPHQQLRPRIIKVEYKDSMLLHRHHITTLLQALLVLCTFSACINDEFADDVAGTGHTTHPCYLNIQLKFDENMSATRAAVTNDDNLEYGDHAEHMIGETGNYIILFKDNNLFDVCDLTAMTGHKHNTEDGRPAEDGGDDSNKNNGVDNNIEATYTYSSKFDAEDEEDFPTSCLVVLNASKKISEKLEDYKKMKSVSVDNILSIPWDEKDVKKEDPKDIGFSDETHKYFTLTNSIYFKKNNAGRRDTVGIPEGFIGKTLAEAKPLTIHVERMVSKFSFELPEKNNKKVNTFQLSEKADMILFAGEFNSDDSPKLNARNWRIALTGWNMNALETENYIFKKIENKNYFWYYRDTDDWNHPQNYRSHWSEDPHYYDNNYPWQYRKAIDYNLVSYEKEVTKANNGDITRNGNLLRNYSFNALGLGRPGDHGEIDLDKSFEEKIIYTPENTYDVDAVKGKHDSRDELLAGTHLLVGAEFQIMLDMNDLNAENEREEEKKYFIEQTTDEDGNIWGTPKHLFRDRNGFYYLSERECIASLVHDFNQLLKSLSSMKFTHYKFWNDEHEENEGLFADTEGEYSLFYKNKTNQWVKLTAQNILEDEDEFPDEDMVMPIAILRKGDGKRLPWIESLFENNRFAIGTQEQVNNNEAPSLSIYGIELDDYDTEVIDKKMLKGNTYTTKNYIKSLLYEWLGAIDHFNQGKMYYSHGVVDNPPIEDYKLRRYGVVRNNWYQFKLNDVTSLGTPVDDLDQPIVPDRNGLNDQINFTIRILDWHSVETGLYWSDF